MKPAREKNNLKKSSEKPQVQMPNEMLWSETHQIKTVQEVTPREKKNSSHRASLDVILSPLKHWKPQRRDKLSLYIKTNLR